MTLTATAPTGDTNINAEKLQAILALLLDDEGDPDEARRQADAIRRMSDEEVQALGQQPPQQPQRHRRGDFLSFAAPRVPGGYGDYADVLGDRRGGQWAAAKDLALMYSELYQALSDAGSPPDDEEVDSANEELAEWGWSVVQDDRGQWHAEESDDTDDSDEGPEPEGATQYRRVSKDYPGAIRQVNPTTGYVWYVDKVTEKKPAVTSAEAVEKRRARGPIDRQKLAGVVKAALEKHEGDAELSDYGKMRSKLSLGMIRRFHGNLTEHRIDELAEQVAAALDRVPEDTPRNRLKREALRLQLQRLHHMIGVLDTAGRMDAEGAALDEGDEDELAAGGKSDTGDGVHPQQPVGAHAPPASGEAVPGPGERAGAGSGGVSDREDGGGAGGMGEKQQGQA